VFIILAVLIIKWYNLWGRSIEILQRRKEKNRTLQARKEYNRTTREQDRSL